MHTFSYIIDIIMQKLEVNYVSAQSKKLKYEASLAYKGALRLRRNAGDRGSGGGIFNLSRSHCAICLSVLPAAVPHPFRERTSRVNQSEIFRISLYASAFRVPYCHLHILQYAGTLLPLPVPKSRVGI